MNPWGGFFLSSFQANAAGFCRLSLSSSYFFNGLNSFSFLFSFSEDQFRFELLVIHYQKIIYPLPSLSRARLPSSSSSVPIYIFTRYHLITLTAVKLERFHCAITLTIPCLMQRTAPSLLRWAAKALAAVRVCVHACFNYTCRNILCNSKSE